MESIFFSFWETGKALGNFLGSTEFLKVGTEFLKNRWRFFQKTTWGKYLQRNGEFPEKQSGTAYKVEGRKRGRAAKVNTFNNTLKISRKLVVDSPKAHKEVL